MRRSSPGKWLAVGWAGLLAAGICLAQETAETPEAPPPEQTVEEAPPPQAQPFAVTEIARQTEESKVALSRILVDLEPQDAVTKVENEIDALTASVASLRAEEADLASLRIARLEELRQRWVRLKSQLDDWQSGLEDRSRTFVQHGDELSALDERWRNTRESAASDASIPPEVLERVDATLGEIEATEERVRERQQVMLALLSRLSGVTVEVNEVLEEFAAAQKQVQQQLFKTEAPPLWDAWPSAEERRELRAELREIFRHDKEALQIWAANDFDRLAVHLLLYLVVVVTLLVLRARSRRWEAEAEEDPALRAAMTMVRRPFSAAAVAAVLPTLWIYPSASRPVFALIFASMVLPLLRLLPQLVYRSMRPAVYGLSGLFLIGQTANLLVPDSLLQRLLLLLLANGLALAGLVWALRPGGPASRVPRDGWWRLVLHLGRIAALLLIAAAVVNIVGGAQLAELMTRGVLNGAFFAMLLLAAFLVLTGTNSMLLRTPGARAFRVVRLHGELIQRRLTGIVQAGLVLIWLWAVLTMFRIWEPVLRGAGSLLGATATIGKIELSPGSVLTFFFTIWVSVKVSQFIRFVLSEEVLPRVRLPRGVPSTISMLVNYTILAFGFLIAVAAAGIEMSQFAILAGALGVGIGFGLQGLVSNFVSGLILIFERPIKVGDTIEVGQLIGEVRSIGIRASTVRTFSGAEVIVPNGNLISNEVVNWTLSDQMRRIEIQVGVAYGTDPARVQELLSEAAGRHSECLEHPEPVSLFLGFGESSLDFELRFWTSTERWRQVASDVTVAINTAIKEAGIEIPFPQRDLHVRSVDERIRLSGGSPISGV